MKPARCPACHRRMKRSNPANAKLWSLYHAIAEKVRPAGVSHSASVWHLYAKSRWLGCDDVTLPNGKVITIPRSSANLDVHEFSDYLDKVTAWAAERGVFLEDMEE